MAANKILNTGHALYGNIVRALSGDKVLPVLRALDGKGDTYPQSYAAGYNTYLSTVSFTNTQGLTRNDTHWFGIDTAAIYKYDLTGAQVASNTSPYSSLPAGVNHCGDSVVSGNYLYVPIVNWAGSVPQTATSQCIVKFNISDLTYDSHFDVSAQVDWNGSGLEISPNGLEIYGTSYNATSELDQRNTDIYRWSLADGSFVGIHKLNQPCVGTQGLAFDGEHWFLTSWDDPTSKIYVYNSSFEFITLFDPVFAAGEIEGICHYDGEIYFHKVGTTVRRLHLNDMLVHKALGTPVKFLDNTDISNACTILMRTTPATLFNYNAVFDNKTTANNWEAYFYADGKMGFRVKEIDFILTAAGEIVAGTEYVLAMGWNNVTGTAAVKLGVNGVVKGTNSGAWVTPPAEGLWIGSANSGNNSAGYSDLAYKDILVFNKYLSDAEIADAYTNFDAFYSVISSTRALSITGLPDGNYIVDFTDPSTGELVARQTDIEFVSGSATSNAIPIAAGTTLEYTIRTATHIAGDSGVTV